MKKKSCKFKRNIRNKIIKEDSLINNCKLSFVLNQFINYHNNLCTNTTNIFLMFGLTKLISHNSKEKINEYTKNKHSRIKYDKWEYMKRWLKQYSEYSLLFIPLCVGGIFISYYSFKLLKKLYIKIKNMWQNRSQNSIVINDSNEDIFSHINIPQIIDQYRNSSTEIHFANVYNNGLENNITESTESIDNWESETTDLDGDELEENSNSSTLNNSWYKIICTFFKCNANLQEDDNSNYGTDDFIHTNEIIINGLFEL